ncbi:MAG: DUF4402 domain-containing protein [Candidatus Marinimicrobia bacterium]|nr:DUF4402 domain-containing protein [Candidatus Neomarinimicrobiota bacterium]
MIRPTFSKISLLITQLALTGILFSQSIQFSVYVTSELNATKQQDLDFQDVITNQGFTPINLGDPGMGVFAVTGNHELDVIVTMTAPTDLTDGSNNIPFTLNFAYANKGVDDINDAILVPSNSIRFQLLEQSNRPTGPPPTPPHSGYIPTESTAYIYIFGSLNIGDVPPGAYSGTVTLTVDYD